MTVTGRFHRLERPKDLAGLGKITYSGIDHLEWAVAGYTGRAGYTNTLPTGENLSTKLSLLTTYFNYDIGSFSFFGLGSIGFLTNTDAIHTINNRVIGERTFGY